MTVNTIQHGDYTTEVVVTAEVDKAAVESTVVGLIEAKGWTKDTTKSDSTRTIFTKTPVNGSEQYEVCLNHVDFNLNMAISYGADSAISAAAFRNGFYHILPQDDDKLGEKDDAFLYFKQGDLDTLMIEDVETNEGIRFYQGQSLIIVDRDNTDQIAVVFVERIYSTTSGKYVELRTLGSTSISRFGDVSIYGAKGFFPSKASPYSIMVSTSENHIGIQVRAPDGRYNDYSAICETENFGGVDYPVICTTGYMNSKGGEVVTGYNRPYSGSFTDSNPIKTFVGEYGYTNGAFDSAGFTPYPTGTFDTKMTGPQEYHGPFGMIASYPGLPDPNHDSLLAAMRDCGNKLSTPFGECGITSADVNGEMTYIDAYSSSSVYAGQTHYNRLRFRGLGDIAPSGSITSAIAATPYAMCLGFGQPTAQSQFDERVVSLYGKRILPKSPWESLRTWSTMFERITYHNSNADLYSGSSVGAQPSCQYGSYAGDDSRMMGRVYGMKVINSGIPAGTTVPVETDGNLFSSAGSTVLDHVAFSYGSANIVQWLQIHTDARPTDTGDYDQWKLGLWDEEAITKVSKTIQGTVLFPL